MKVTLISCTANAAELLLFTKSTRLTMSPGLMAEIVAWPPERKAEELKYMANTIPSSWEFVDYTFLVEGVSRAYTHQQVRTRAGSYAQQTMRVLEMGDYDYVKSPRIVASARANRIVDQVNEAIRSGYRSLLAEGVPPEDARGVLPTNIATNIVCKFNLRTLAELARSRTGGRTQGEYQSVVNGMIDAALAVHPWASDFLFPKGRGLFDEIEAWVMKEFPDNLMRRGEVLKIVDRMRKELQ